MWERRNKILERRGVEFFLAIAIVFAKMSSLISRQSNLLNSWKIVACLFLGARHLVD